MLMASSETQNMTMLFSCADVPWFVNRSFIGQRHRPVRNDKMGDIEQLSTRTCADEPVDVKRAKQEDERVNRTKDRERDRRLARRQERRHGIRGSQHSKDHPRLTADLSSEPAGDDRNKGQRKAQKSQPKQRTIVCEAVPVAQ